MIFKVILVCLLLCTYLSEQYQAQDGVQYSVRFDNPTIKIRYDFTMPKSDILYGFIQNPYKVEGLSYSLYRDLQFVHSREVDSQTNQTDFFFKGYLKQGETLGLELFIKKFDYNSFDPNSDYSRVSFMTHDNKQRENYQNNDGSTNKINVYGPLAARTQLDIGPLNQPVIQYGAIQKYCYYLKLTPEEQKSGSLSIYLKARERYLNSSRKYWEKFAIVTKGITQNQINDTTNWPEIYHTKHDQYSENNLIFPVKQQGGFKNEYLAISVYVDSIKFQRSFFSFDIEIQFPQNIKFLE